jgi:predicted DNA-binding WGR domain protein
MLTLVAEMTYVEQANGRFGSNKFYIAILAGATVHAHYGRRNASGLGQHAAYHFGTEDEASAKMWSLLRSKTSKGYHVVDAAVMDVGTGSPRGVGRRTAQGEDYFAMWRRLSRGERAEERQAVVRHPVRLGISARTPKQGKQVLQALTNPGCPEADLLECALARPAERFLPPMAMSHPNCTDEARVARFLSVGSVPVGAV